MKSPMRNMNKMLNKVPMYWKVMVVLLVLLVFLNVSEGMKTPKWIKKARKGIKKGSKKVRKGIKKGTKKVRKGIKKGSHLAKHEAHKGARSLYHMTK